MIDFGKIVAFARSELRLIRRLVRYWIFVVLACFFSIVGYLYYAVGLHMLFSSWSGSVSSINPRFIVGGIGLWFILIYCIGLVFIAFDIRARDRRERFFEVLDARPYRNLELVLGRFLGQLASGWIPMAIVWTGISILGLAIRAPIEPWSVFGMLTYMAIPAFSFTIGLTYVVTLLVRNRLIAGVLTLGLLVAQFVALIRSTLLTLPWFDVTGAYSMEFPSDIVTRIADGEGLLQRIGVTVVSLGLLVLAAGLYPRLERGKNALRLAGAGLAAVGIVAVGLVVVNRTSVAEQRDAWRAAHEAVAPETTPDVVALSADVDISGGRSLGATARMTIQPALDEPLAVATFSLNPGLAVSSVTSDGAGELSFEQHDGLLEVTLPEPLQPGRRTELAVTYDGRLDLMFGYLDSAVNIYSVTLQNGQVFLLGYQNGFLEKRFAALMPGLHWLPSSGAAVAAKDARLPRRDPYHLELAVKAPDGWTIAGPGRRSVEGATTRFVPPAPVPEVAIVGGRFVSRQVEVDGVLFEILLDPDHAGVLDTLAAMKDELRSELETRLADARELGLDYPYGAFTLVEVPTQLRGYGGGWRMDSTLAQPAMMLLKESGFPTSRFDWPFRKPENFKDREGGIARAMLNRVAAHFEYDFNGGNVFMGAPKNFFTYQTAPRGESALALDSLMEMLAARLITERQGYFSVHLFDQDVGPLINELVTKMLIGGSDSVNIAEELIGLSTSRPEVWEAVLGQSLSGLDPWEDPRRTLDALTLKGGAAGQALHEKLGSKDLGLVLSRLREASDGGTFTRDDVVAAAGERADDVRELLDLWLDETTLPGFVVERAEAFRLDDQADGTPRYQLLVTIRNDEPAPGLLRLRYSSGTGDDRKPETTEAVAIPGRSSVRIGVVGSTAFYDVRVAPYLSLNREEFVVSLAAIDEEKIVAADPVSGAEPVPWSAPVSSSVVVDDLDGGFEVADVERRSLFGFRGGASDLPMDQGLPILRTGSQPTRWSRISVPEAHGRYRHTAALVMTTGAESSASWSAELPSASRYTLEIFLPPKSAFRALRSNTRGSWALELTDSSGSQEAVFDADAAVPGWNEVGAFELASGDVEVELTMKEGGRMLLADAIRLSPAESRGVESR